MTLKFNAEVKLGSSQGKSQTPERTIDNKYISDLVVTSTLDYPDTCALTLTKNGADALGPSMALADPLSVKLSHGDADNDMAFVGEVTGLEPTYGGRSQRSGTLVVRGLNALHRLSRGKRTYAYSSDEGKLTDEGIINEMLQQRYPTLEGVFADPNNPSNTNTKPPEVNYYRVFQHNQTDLEFLRLRAARIGCYFLVRDKKLMFWRRDSAESGFKLHAGDYKGRESTDMSLEYFNPRVSTANQVMQVMVRSFIPAERRYLKCTAPGDGVSIKSLGELSGVDVSKDAYKASVVVRVNVPFSTKEEGDALALSILNERLLDHVRAEGQIAGDARLKPGMVVEVTMGGNPRYDGYYFITSVRHSYHGGNHPFTTEFHACRDAIAKPDEVDPSLC
jgi:hypothetical protein